MKPTALFLALFALIASGAPSYAHYPPGVTYKVFQFPDDHLPVMDGDASDWNVVPKDYVIGTHALEETVKGLDSHYDPKDLGVKVKVGWNKTQNRLYFLCSYYDDIHNFDGVRLGYPHGDDIWEIVIDGDHSADQIVGFGPEGSEIEDRMRSAKAQNYHLFAPPFDEHWMWYWGKATWVDQPQFSAMGWKADCKTGESGTVTYEVSLTPFDDLHWAGPDSSKVHRLKEGEIVGISWAFLDFDKSDKEYDGFWNLSRHTMMYGEGKYLVDFLLEPVRQDLFKAPPEKARRPE